MTDKKNPRHYWGITVNGVECYRGTFNECWDELVATYPMTTLSDLTAAGVRISRVNGGVK